MKRTLGLLLMLVMVFTCIGGAFADDTLHALLPNCPLDRNTLYSARVIEEKTGYKIEYDQLPADNWLDTLGMIVPNTEDYDYIMANTEAQNLIMNLAKDGALVDLTPYLEDHPNLASVITDYSRSTFSIDGKLYAIGMEALSFDGYGEVRELMFYRQDWLDKLNMKAPTTVDEFTELLRALKAYDNGTEEEVIPLTLVGSGTGVYVPGLIGAFGIPNEWNEVDGKLVNRAEDPRLLEYLSYMKGLYQEGLIDQGFPANTSANVTEKYSTGKAGIAPLYYWSCPTLFDTMATTQPDQKTGFMFPLKGANGDIGIGTSMGGFEAMVFIPKASKHVDETIDLFEKKLDPETFVSFTLGEEGVHYTLKDGLYSPILPKFFDDMNWAISFCTGRPTYWSTLWMCRAQKDQRQWEYWQYMNMNDEMKAVNVTSKVAMAPTFGSSANKDALDQMLLDQCIRVIAGEASVDDWGDFLEKWYAEGGRQLVDDYNNWWSTFELK